MAALSLSLSLSLSLYLSICLSVCLLFFFFGEDPLARGPYLLLPSLCDEVHFILRKRKKEAVFGSYIKYGCLLCSRS